MNPQMFYDVDFSPFRKGALKDLYPTEDEKEVRGRLDYLLECRGVAVICGGAGVGKTSSIRSYCEKLNKSLYNVIYLHLTTVTPTGFLRELAFSLGLEPRFHKADLFRQIQNEISYRTETKKCVPVIVIDEAHLLPAAVFDDLVPLLNFNMDSSDKCILILCGLKSLNSIMSRARNEALRQRTVVNYEFEGLSEEEASAYVGFALEKAHGHQPVFSKEALNAAYGSCQHSIRNLNQILDMSMKIGSSRKELPVQAETVRLACEEIKI